MPPHPDRVRRNYGPTPEPRVYTPEELRKIELVTGLLERGFEEMDRVHDAEMERLELEWANATDR